MQWMMCEIQFEYVIAIVVLRPNVGTVETCPPRHLKYPHGGSVWREASPTAQIVYKLCVAANGAIQSRQSNWSDSNVCDEYNSHGMYNKVRMTTTTNWKKNKMKSSVTFDHNFCCFTVVSIDCDLSISCQLEPLDICISSKAQMIWMVELRQTYHLINRHCDIIEQLCRTIR